jgi:hypothetical protein
MRPPSRRPLLGLLRMRARLLKRAPSKSAPLVGQLSGCETPRDKRLLFPGSFCLVKTLILPFNTQASGRNRARGIVILCPRRARCGRRLNHKNGSADGHDGQECKEKVSPSPLIRPTAGRLTTAHYGCKLLVWFEFDDSMQDAIAREKRIKAGSRKKKLMLIERTNTAWRDLFEGVA